MYCRPWEGQALGLNSNKQQKRTQNPGLLIAGTSMLFCLNLAALLSSPVSLKGSVSHPLSLNLLQVMTDEQLRKMCDTFCGFDFFDPMIIL